MSDDANGTDGDIFQEKYLWEDPLIDSEGGEYRSGPVLLAEEIQKYSEKYGLLIADNIDQNDLKGASYYLKPDPYNAWRFDEKGQQLMLHKSNTEKKQYFLVPQNSLVYIRLQQKLRLPYYIIGRHNLIIPYVYQGLLLGTGPQVDPGYVGNLFIPLHNLTNRDVKIYLNDWFVSIDFVRTSQLLLKKGMPHNDKEFRKRYPEKHPIHREKLERLQLEDYLKGANPLSSLGIYVSRLEESEKKASNAQNQLDEKIKDATNKVNDEINRAEKKISESTTKSETTINRIESLQRLEFIGLIALFFIFLSGWYVSYYHLDSKLESKTQILIQGVQNQLPAIQELLIDLDRSLKNIFDQNAQVEKKDQDNYNLKIDSIRGTIKDLSKKFNEVEKKIENFTQTREDKNK